MPSSHIPLPDLKRLDAEQQRVADEVASGPRKEVRGPMHVWLHSPELASRAQKLGEFLRWGTTLDARISELVILVTARHYDCRYMWNNHVGLALKAGLTQKAIDAIDAGRPPFFANADEAARQEEHDEADRQSRRSTRQTPDDHANADQQPARPLISPAPEEWRGQHVADQEGGGEGAELELQVRVVGREDGGIEFDLRQYRREDLAIDVVEEVDGQ